MDIMLRYLGFVVCSLIGFLIGYLFFPEAAAYYASVIISYHLYLGILILLSRQKKGISLPIGQTIVTHIAFLMVMIGLPFARHYIPFYGILRFFIPSIALFEVKWLFSKDTVPEKTTQEEAKTIQVAPSNKADRGKKKIETFSVDDLINNATAQEHEEFLAYLRQPHRVFRQPGRTIREEYGHWLASSAKRRPAVEAPVAAAGSSDVTEATNPSGVAEATNPSGVAEATSSPTQ